MPETKPIFLVGWPTSKPKEMRERMEPKFPGYHVLVYPCKSHQFDLLTIKDATALNFKELLNHINALMDGKK